MNTVRAVFFIQSFRFENPNAHTTPSIFLPAEPPVICLMPASRIRFRCFACPGSG